MHKFTGTPELVYNEMPPFSSALISHPEITMEKKRRRKVYKDAASIQWTAMRRIPGWLVVRVNCI
jgi:hypothetical protein